MEAGTGVKAGVITHQNSNINEVNTWWRKDDEDAKNWCRQFLADCFCESCNSIQQRFRGEKRFL